MSRIKTISKVLFIYLLFELNVSALVLIVRI